MKKIIILLGVIGVSFTSCSDFLEEENLANVTAAEFYATAEGFETLVNASYSQLREIYGDEAYMFCSGTDMYAEGRSPEPDGLSKYLQLSSSSDGVDHIYTTCFSAIRIANTGLYYADVTEQTSTLDTRIGELKYHRANAYFLLVQTYGGVSIVTDLVDSPILSFDRNSAVEVYSLIISDLNDALSRVSAKAYKGRVTQRAVQHLLAKVHLTRGYENFGEASDFATAASFADDAISGQSLTIPFGELWLPGNDDNEEVIFSVQFSESSVSANPTELGNRQAHYFGSYFGGIEIAEDAPYRSYNLCPTDYALGLYTADDSRWEGTFMHEIFTRYYDFYDEDDHASLTISDFYEPEWFTAQDKIDYLAAANLASDFEYHDWGTHSAQVQSLDYATISVRKFDDPKSPFGSGRVSTRDLILSRLGDTYLLAAEAYFKANDAATGLNRLNEVRNRAGVADATLGEFDIDYILDERGRELLGEYHRWFDLKRTGTLVERASLHHYLVEESNFSGANGELKILRPIPQTALDLNQNKDFPQNPAYN